MNVLVVEPGVLPYEKEINGLEEMQATVGGMIDAIYPYEEPVALVCNDEGILLGLPFNRSVENGYGGIFGTFFVCGLGEENFDSLSPEHMEKFKEKFKRAEILLVVMGDQPFTLKVEARPRQQEKTTEHEQPQR